MSLDSVVFALKSCFKTKHQKSFFILLTQVYVGFVQLYVTEITVITCSVKGTAVLLAVAETLHGKSFPRGDFPHLICRPCSRRLNNTKLLQDQIDKSQASFESEMGERFKRCIEIYFPLLRRQSKVLAILKTTIVQLHLPPDGILSSSRPKVLEYPPTLQFWMNKWSRDQPQPGSFFQRPREAEKKDPGNEVVHIKPFSKEP